MEKLGWLTKQVLFAPQISLKIHLFLLCLSKHLGTTQYQRHKRLINFSAIQPVWLHTEQRNVRHNGNLLIGSLDRPPTDGRARAVWPPARTDGVSMLAFSARDVPAGGPSGRATHNFHDRTIPCMFTRRSLGVFGLGLKFSLYECLDTCM
jgi:hypothetical protein